MVIGLAAVAPVYSLAATLGYVVPAVGAKAPSMFVLAFIPMLLLAFAYKEPSQASLLLLTVSVSALSSTHTTILPTARGTLSMAVYEAIPKRFASVHPRYMTPAFGTIVMGPPSVPSAASSCWASACSCSVSR